MSLNSIALVLLLAIAMTGCATKSLHSVQESVPVGLGNYNVSVSTNLQQINWSGQFKNSKFFTRNQGHAVKSYFLVHNQKNSFQAGFFGNSNSTSKKIKSYSEQINDIHFTSDIYAYDFRFNRGGGLMELIDKSVNRSCGVVKVYTNKVSSLQLSYGKVIDCATLQMSLSNYKTYKISEVVSELNETAKATFNIEKI
jgi:hypothetical protein